MSVDVMSAVWKQSRATGSARLLLLAIADNANSEGKAYPSIKRLAQKVNTSERNIQFLLRKLVELGELAIELQAERRGCNAYYVLLGTNGGEEAFTGGVKRLSPGGGEEAFTGGGEEAFTGGVKRLSPEPSVEPSIEPSLGERARATPPPPAPPAAKVIICRSPNMPRGLQLPMGYVPAGMGANAVQVYYERFRYDNPDARLTAPQEDDLVRICTDLGRLREVIVAYSQTNYRPGNIRLILDWYARGVPERPQGGANAVTQHSQPGRGNAAGAGAPRPAWANYTAEPFDAAFEAELWGNRLSQVQGGEILHA